MALKVPKDILTDITLVAIDMLYMSKDSRNALIRLSGALVDQDRDTRERLVIREVESVIEDMADQTPAGDTRDPRLDG